LSKQLQKHLYINKGCLTEADLLQDRRIGWHFEDRENKIKPHSSSKIQIEKPHKILCQTKNTVCPIFRFMQLSPERILISCPFNGLVFSIV
jgi:hypothetical protein